MSLRIYLAGPMSGLPEHNYPAFHAEAARLRAIGFHVENPAENPAQDSWQAYMSQAVAQLVKCDVVALLPGWENSRGALIENGLAVSLGIPVRKAAEFQAPQPKAGCWMCVGGLPQCDNARSVPKRPVIWFGEVWLRMPNGDRHARGWRSHNKITRQQAQDVLRAMLDDLIEECGRDSAVDSGFRMECR